MFHCYSDYRLGKMPKEHFLLNFVSIITFSHIHSLIINIILGYNNLCVGWDEDPANKVAVVLWVFVAYLCIRFVTMNHLRFVMKEGKHFWYKIANLSFFIGVLCFALTLAIPPTVSVYWHSAVREY